MIDVAALKPGTMLVVEHPTRHEAYTVARTYGSPLKSMIRLQYWMDKEGEFDRKPTTRAHRAVFAVLPAETDPAVIQRQLNRAAAALTNALRGARQQFNDRVKSIAEGAAA